jgi:hypothetical protein
VLLKLYCPSIVSLTARPGDVLLKDVLDLCPKKDLLLRFYNYPGGWPIFSVHKGVDYWHDVC